MAAGLAEAAQVAAFRAGHCPFSAAIFKESSAGLIFDGLAFNGDGCPVTWCGGSPNF
jgi:hypothetical protein